MHLTIDGFGGDRERLSDEALVGSLLDRFPADIGMTKISEPKVWRYVGEKQEDWGISGFVLIAESHITIHTFPDHGLVWADIFSCKEFEAPGATEKIARCFGLAQIKTRILERGLEYPHSISAALPLAMDERLAVAGELVGAEAGA